MSGTPGKHRPTPAERALRQQFLHGMSHAACTVNVVTTDGIAGRHGVTVSAMVSVSADTPQPTLLVCIHHLSPVVSALLENGVFCVNVLRDDQAHISDNFAGRSGVQGAAKFDCATWTTQLTGAPRVVDSLVAFDCRVTASERVGSHFVNSRSTAVRFSDTTRATWKGMARHRRPNMRPATRKADNLPP
jgi:flavin reductase (DIM6/NTAB) family NADH-FMN oxidoreductase RutF